MKKFFICLFCLTLIISLIPVNEFEVSAAVRVLPQRTNAYNKYNHTAGLNWLSNQEEVEAIVNTENSKPDEDNSIYDIAKNSIIMKLDNPIAYAQGYKNYIDMDNTTVAPFIQDGNVFVPIKYIAENLGAEFIWDNNKKQALIEGSETTKIIVEKNEIVINDSGKVITVSPVMNDETLFVPTNAIELIFQQKVLYDERGVIIITTEAIQEMIEDRHWDLIAQSDFDLDRKKIVYPHKQDVIRLMMSSSNRSALNTDVSTMQEEIAPYLKMSYKELAEYVEEESQYNEDGTKRHMGERPDFYRAALFMSLLYEMNPNEDLAMRIIIMAYHSAICFDSLATYDWNAFYNYTSVVPEQIIFACDKIYHSPMWKIASEKYGFDLWQVCTEWWTTIYDYIIVNKEGLPVGNYPVWLNGIAGIATVLDDPDKVRDILPIFEIAYMPHSFYADGMWYEGSFNYGSQMVGNVNLALTLLADYHDPFGYVDEIYGYRMLTGIAKSKEWSAFTEHVRSLKNLAAYPDGSVVSVNDTHWDLVEQNLIDNTVKEPYIGSNIEMNHFGLFGLRYGDMDNAQQVNMLIQATSGVSHQHYAPLGMSFYSADVELLPDEGYVQSSANVYRYTKTGAMGHNVAFMGQHTATSKGGTYYIRPNLLAYDDGSRTNKQIQIVEGSNLLTKDKRIDANRRLLMLIATDKNHSYVVDIQRLKGTELHEVYLQPRQEEEVVIETDLELSGEMTGLFTEWLEEHNIYGGYVNGSAEAHSKPIKNPRGVVTDNSFKITTIGKTTGSTLNTFFKGNKDTVVAITQMPTARRANKDVSKKDDFYSYMTYRGRNVDKDESTIYGTVYEGFKKDENAKVQNVTWYEPEDLDDMTTMLKVETDSYIDYIYISNDKKVRKMEDISFSGDVAVLRKDLSSGNVVYGYIYGEGSIVDGEYILTGKKNLSYRVIGADGARDIYEDAENYLRVNGIPPKDIEGLWCNVSFSDNSGIGYKIEKVEESVVNIHNDPGFTVDEDGAKFTAYPMYENHNTQKLASFASPFDEGMQQRYREGEVVFTVKYPTFSQKQSATEEALQHSGTYKVFTDVPDSHWVAEYINKLYDEKIVSGMDENTYAPEANVTRAEFLKLLIEALGLQNEKSGNHVYNDVPSDSWYAKYVYIASELGITEGTGNGNFSPNASILRRDMAVLAYRAIKVANKTLDKVEEKTLIDNDNIAEYARESVKALSDAGIISGTEKGEFLPDNNATRAESAKIIYMMKEQVK